jgi:hypothetical protein
MAVVQINAQLTPDDILEAVKQFSPSELEMFTRQVQLIQAQRKTPHLSRQEAELLQKINQAIPAALWPSYKKLVAKRDENSLTEAEHEALLRLSDQIERLHAERIGYLVELAQLRNVSLTDLMGEHPPK